MENLKEIIVNCIRNSNRDQRILYEQFYGYCLKTVFRYVYHYDKAVDVVNDGFIKIFRNLHKFEFKPDVNTQMLLMGWMRMIMVNTAIDHLRQNQFAPEIGEIPDYVWESQDKSQSSDQHLLYKELIKEIKKLPPGYRAVFNMYVIDGFTHKEISEQLGISIGTSKSNLSKARMLLQNILKKSDQARLYATTK
ncbi:MAG: RNA polymerase sigma factor [Flavitalea sp.]